MDDNTRNSGTGTQQPMTGQSPGETTSSQTTGNDLSQQSGTLSDTGEQQNTGTTNTPRDGSGLDKGGDTP